MLQKLSTSWTKCGCSVTPVPLVWIVTDQFSAHINGWLIQIVRVRAKRSISPLACPDLVISSFVDDDDDDDDDDGIPTCYISPIVAPSRCGYNRRSRRVWND